MHACTFAARRPACAPPPRGTRVHEIADTGPQYEEERFFRIVGARSEEAGGLRLGYVDRPARSLVFLTRGRRLGIMLTAEATSLPSLVFEFLTDLRLMVSYQLEKVPL